MGSIESPALNRISGHANPKVQQFRQVANTTKQTVNFWAFTAVNGDAVVSELHNVDDTSALAYLGNGIAYQDDSQIVRIIAEIGSAVENGGLTVQVKDVAL